MNIYSSKEANMHIGEIAVVQGTLYNVYISNKGNLFLNVDGKYPNQKFSGVIFNEYVQLFNISKLKNKIGNKIMIKGFIKRYKGKAEIIIRERNQILNN